MNNPPTPIDRRGKRGYNTREGDEGMFNARRRRIAWLFTLVLALELAVLCCASIHLSDHACCGDECAICACVRAGLRRAALAALVLTALIAATVLRRAFAVRRAALGASTLIDRKVRLND